ncbi:MAG: hypothetical protein WBQ72_23000, partial [Terriglobales bacterium]
METRTCEGNGGGAECQLHIPATAAAKGPTQAKRRLEWGTVNYDTHRTLGGWAVQALCRLEWGSSTAGRSVPAARSRLLAVHSHSIST